MIVRKKMARIATMALVLTISVIVTMGSEGVIVKYQVSYLKSQFPYSNSNTIYNRFRRKRM